jgi:hypothetical protein
MTAAKKFAKMNPGKLILACRSQTKGDNAVKSAYIFLDVHHCT